MLITQYFIMLIYFSLLSKVVQNQILHIIYFFQYKYISKIFKKYYNNIKFYNKINKNIIKM